MTSVLETGLVINIVDHSPEERREYLIKAISSAMRWYAFNPDKRKTDADSVAVLADLMDELSTMDL